MNAAAMTLLADGVTRRVFEWGRIQSNSDWIAPVAVALGLMLVARLLYRKDAGELPRWLEWLLVLLRTLVVFALLLIYLQPQWRTEQEQRVNSRALVLVDNSLSMGLADGGSDAASRARQVAESLDRSKLIDRLRVKHDVRVLRFGEKLEPLVSLDRVAEEDANQGNDASAAQAEASPPAPPSERPSQSIAWEDLLAPTAVETRLGEALRGLVDQERDAPVSGIILITDGGQNAGAAPEAAIETARQARVPVFSVGVGSATQPANVRVSDFVAPARAYPGDQYTAVGYVQAQGMPGRVVTVQLFVKPADGGAPTPGDGDLVESREVILGTDGEVLPVRFVIAPKEAGRETLTFAVKSPPGDANADDDRRQSDVEVVDHKNRVLLLAGGPMREYRFLRNLLHRDASFVVDVLLQTAQPGISQEAHELLADFPATREEMFRYDCVVAIDPDWQALSDEQIGLLEGWVAEQGGGLVIEAGPVHMGNPISGWIQDPRMAKIRALAPVTFERRFATDTTSYSSSEPWPLAFTREGLEAEFLWLGDERDASEEAWAAFSGVYSFYPVEGAKPGAVVLARFSDPHVGSGDRRPVYAAIQFYGSGRVLYLGSAELWRLRAVDETWFDTICTKLLRHVSQGRLARGSSRGALVVDRDRYVLGSAVEVRAQLTDERLEPLRAESITMQVFQPSGVAETVALRADPGRAGMFVGHFTVWEEGAWRLELPIPQSDERLTRRIQVKMPDLERENPQRNDALLAKIARQTGGRYYVDLAVAFSGDRPDNVVNQLPDRTRTIVLRDAPDRLARRRWLGVMMAVVCGLLFAEWLVRRLVKLA